MNEAQTTIMKELHPLAALMVRANEAKAHAAATREESNSALANLSNRLGSLERLALGESRS